MGQWKHRMLAVDPDTRRGLCSFCGPVDIMKKDGRWKCRTARREQQRGSRDTRPNRGYRYGVCPICERDGPLVWDHDHETGAERGWLCPQCNAGLGMLGDTKYRIEKALAYLKR